MNHKLRDMIWWGIIAIISLVVVFWLGSARPPGVPEHLPPASEYRAIGELFCFLAAFDALLIVIVHVFTGAKEMTPSGTHERRHAGRILFMASIAFTFSLAGAILWYLPFKRSERWLTESPVIGGALVMIGILSGLAMALARRRQNLFDRRHSLHV